jgi:hypothetical protein
LRSGDHWEVVEPVTDRFELQELAEWCKKADGHYSTHSFFTSVHRNTDQVPPPPPREKGRPHTVFIGNGTDLHKILVDITDSRDLQHKSKFVVSLYVLEKRLKHERISHRPPRVSPSVFRRMSKYQHDAARDRWLGSFKPMPSPCLDWCSLAELLSLTTSDPLVPPSPVIANVAAVALHTQTKQSQSTSHCTKPTNVSGNCTGRLPTSSIPKATHTSTPQQRLKAGLAKLLDMNGTNHAVPAFPRAATEIAKSDTPIRDVRGLAVITRVLAPTADDAAEVSRREHIAKFLDANRPLIEPHRPREETSLSTALGLVTLQLK